LLDELKKQSSFAEVHLHDVRISLSLAPSPAKMKIVDPPMFPPLVFQLRSAVATLASEGFVVLHGDSVKRV